jgi:hypothetical protein
MSSQVYTSGDVTVTISYGFLGSNPTVTVACRRLPQVARTPQQLTDWIAAFVDAEAKAYDFEF